MLSDVRFSPKAEIPTILTFYRLRIIYFYVGPHRSRPASFRHIAQALHLARASGRGLLAKCHRSPQVQT